MATEIDQKVVQMTFDNANFERNARTTINTLEQLNSKSSFDGMAKGLQEVDRAAKDVDISILGKAATTVGDQFSAMSVVAITAISKITSQAIDAGEKIVKALTIDQVTEGFGKYEDKLTSVRTIMNSTGLSVEEVNAQLERLNWFTDETSYNFVDMVDNIGKFTNNQIPLDQAVTAMQGIANWAAVSGQGINEAGRAMYNLSQAIGVGAVKLIDWKSIENANMATAEFKQQVIDAAVAAGTLLKNGEKYYTVAKGTEVSVSNFTDALSTEKWFTSDVLMDVLTEYGSFANEVYEIYQNSDMMTSDIIEKLRSMPGFMETIGSKAFAAAQEYKTLGDAINATKDAVSTGWMNTFEMIIGNTEEAKQVWTAFGDALYDIFAASGEFRNELVSGWREAGGRDVLFEGLAQSYENLLAVIEPVNQAINSMFPPMTVERLVAMTNAFADFTKQFQLSEDAAKSLNTIVRALLIPIKAIVAVIKIAGSGIGALLIVLFRLIDGVLSLAHNGQLVSTVLEKLSGVMKAVFGEERYARIMESLNTIVEKLAPHFDALREKILEFSHSNNLLEAAGNILQTILGVLIKIGNIGLDGIVSFFEMLARLDYTDLRSFANSVLKELDSGINTLGNTLKKFGSYVIEGLDSGMGSALTKLISTVKNIGSTIVTTFANFMGIHSPSRVMRQQGQYVVQGLAEGISSTTVAERAMLTQTTKLTSIVGNAVGEVARQTEKMNPIISASSLIVKGAGAAVDGVRDSIEDLGDTTNTSGNGVLQFVQNLAHAIADFLSKLTPGKIIILAFGVALTYLTTSLAKFFDGFTGVMGAASTVLENFGSIFKRQSTVIQQAALLIGVLAASLILLSSVDSSKLLDSATAMVATMLGVSLILAALAGLQKIMGDKGETIRNVAIGLTLVSGAMTLLATSMISLANIQFWAIVGAIGEIFIAIIALSTGVSMIANFVKKGDFLSASVMILALSAAIVIIMNTIQKIADIDVGGAFVNMALLVPIMAALVSVSWLAGKVKAGGAIGAIAFVASIPIFVNVLAGLNNSKMDTIRNNLYNLTALFPVLLGLVFAARVAGKSAGSFGVYIIAVSVAIRLLLGTMEMLGGMDRYAIERATYSIATLITAFGLLTFLSKIGDGEVGKIGSQVMFVTVAVMALSFLISALGSLDDGVVLKGTGTLVAIMAMLGVLVAVGKVGEKSKSGAGTFLIIAIAIGILSGLVVMISEIPGEEALVSAFTLLILAGALKMFSKSFVRIKWNSVIAVLVAGIAMTAALYYFSKNLSEVEWSTMLSQAGAMSLAMVALAAAFRIMSKTKDIDGSAIIGFSLSSIVIVLTLAEAFKAMSGVDGLNAIGQATAIGLAGLAMGGMFKTIAGVSPKDDLMKNVAAFVIASVPILLTMGVAFSLMGSIDALTAVGQSVAIGLASVGLAGMFAIMGSVDRETTKRTSDFITSAVVVVIALALLFNAMRGIDGPTAILQAVSLGLVANALAYAFTIFNQLSTVKSNGDYNKLLTAFIKICAVMIGVVAALGAINAVMAAVGFAMDWQLIAAEILGISVAVVAIGGATALIGLIPSVAAEGASSTLLAMLKVLGIVAAVVLAIGAINELFGGGVAEFISSGGEVLIAIGEAIGGFIGALVGSIAGQALGSALSSFQDELMSFTEAMAGVDDSAVTGVERMASIMTTLSGAAFTQMLSGGKKYADLFKDLGDGLTEFAPAFVDFAASMEDFDGANVEAVSNAAKAIADMSAAFGTEDGALSFWTGERVSLATIGEELATFGPGMATFAEAIGDLDEDIVNKAISAGEAFAGLTDKMPKKDGWAQKIMGTADMVGFAEGMKEFGEALVAYSAVLTGQVDVTVGNGAAVRGPIDETAIKNSATAAEGLVLLENKLRGHGTSLFTMFAGEANLADFGGSLLAFGAGLVGYSSIITGKKAISMKVGDGGNITVSGSIDSAAIKSSADAAEGLVLLEGKLTGHGSIWSMFGGGDQTLGEFGESLVMFGIGLAAYSTAISANGGIDQDQVDDSVEATKKLVELKGALGDKEGNIFDIFSNKAGFEDFGKGIKAFGDGLGAYSDGINKLDIEKASKVDEIVEDLVYVSNHVSNFNAEAMKNFSNALSSVAVEAINQIAANDFSSQVDRFLNNFSSALSEKRSRIETGANAVRTSLYNAITNSSTASIKASNLIDFFVNGLAQKGSSMTRAGEAMLARFYLGLNSEDVNASEAAKEMTDTIQRQMMENLGVTSDSSAVFEMIGRYIANGIQNGITGRQVYLEKELNTLFKDVFNSLNDELDVFGSYSRTFYTLGQYAVQGIIEGMKDAQNGLDKQITMTAGALVNSFRRELGIHSPSVVMKEQGVYLVQGIAEGIDSDTSAEDAMAKKAQNIVSAFQTELAKWDLDATTADLEYQLWEALNPDASEEAITLKNSELLEKKLEYQAEAMALAQAEYEATLRTLGETAEETQEAYNKFLQEQIDMASLAAQAVEDQEEFDPKALSASLDAYIRLKDQMYDQLKSWGATDEQIEEYLYAETGWQSGMEAWFMHPPEKLTVEDVINSYMKDVIVEIDDTIYKSVANGNGAASLANGLSASFDTDYSDLLNFDASSLTSGIEDAMSALNFDDILGGGEGGVHDWISTLGNMFDTAGSGWASELFSFLTGEGDGSIFTAFDSTWSKIKASASSFLSNDLPKIFSSNSGEAVEAAAEMGDNVDNGMATGIYRNQGVVVKAVRTVAGAAITAGNEAFLIESPSRVFSEMGMWIDRGLALGLTNNADYVTNSTEELGNQAIDSMSIIVDSVQQLLDSDMDFEPTIRPVMDLSDIESGVGAIDNYFGRSSAVAIGVQRTTAKQRREEIQNGNTLTGKSDSTAPVYNFTQNNYSPKALSKAEIYRQTRNQFSMLKGKAGST